MKKVLFLSLFLCSLTFASSEQQVEETIREIRSELRNNYHDAETLRRADLMLHRVLDTLRSGQGGGQDRCVEFAYEKYSISYSSSTAMQKARQACSKISDVDVAKVFYEYAYKSLSSSSAMELAANYSGSEAFGKARIAEYMLEKYFISLSSSASVRKAGAGIRVVSYNSFSCLRRSFEAYYRQYSSTTAMDKAIQDCRF